MRALQWLLLIAVVGLGGCVTIAAYYIETPGHHGPRRSFKQGLASASAYTQRSFTTAQGLHIAYWYSPPARLDIHERLSTARPGNSMHAFHFNFDFSRPKKPAHPLRTRGSAVLLQPWGQNAVQMALWGVYFSNAGYVTVMPALRSQGDSGNAPVGYGPREAGDNVQLIHYLQGKRELPPPLYLLGYSYGATVALFAAPKLPHVRGVIAMAPYVHPVHVIERAPDTNLFTPSWWPGFLPQHILQKAFSPRVMQEAIKRAGKQLGIDLATIDPGNAVAASHACTLLLRGDEDQLTSGQADKMLAERSPRAQFVPVPGANHITLFFNAKRLFPPILAWMQAIPASGRLPCPAFGSPASS